MVKKKKYFTTPIGKLECIEGDCFNGYGKGIIGSYQIKAFKSDLTKELKSGLTNELKSELIIEGNFINGDFKEGKQIFRIYNLTKNKHIDMKITEGKFLNYKSYGKIKTTFFDGTVLEANYDENNKMYGISTFTSISGAVKKRIHKNGKTTLIEIDFPFGVLKDLSGDGINFENQNQKLKFIWSNDDVFEGLYPIGKGILKYSDGVIVEGEFRNFVPTSGKIIYPNGDIYEGSIFNKYLFSIDNFTYEVNTEADCSISRSLLNDFNIYPDFEKKMVNLSEQNCEKWRSLFFTQSYPWKQGKGKMIYNNGDIYEGFWALDLKQGEGKMIYNNGDVKKGYWLKDKFKE